MASNPIPDPTQQPTPSTGGKVRDFASGIFQGLAGAAGNQGLYDRIAAQRKEQRDQVGAGQQMSIQAHALAVKGLRQKLAQLDPQKDAQAYQQTVDQIQGNIHAMRELVNPDQQLPAGEWLKTHLTDRMHITNHDARVKQLQAKQQAGVRQDQQTAQALAQGTVAVPQFLTPEEQAEAARIKAGLDPKAGVMTATGLHHADYLAYKKDHPEDRRSEEEWVQAEAAKGRASAPMSEYQKAQDAYKNAQLLFQKAKLAASQDPSNPATKAAMLRAQGELTKSAAYMMRAKAGTQGTDMNNNPLPGAMLTTEGDPIGSMFSGNYYKSQQGRAQLNDAAGAIRSISGTVQALYDSGSSLNRPNVAAALANPEWTSAKLLQGIAGKTLTPAEAQAVISIRSAQENIQGMRQAAGGGLTDEQVNRLEAQLPSAATPDKDYATAQIDYLDQTLSRLAEGVPSTIGGSPFRPVKPKATNQSKRPVVQHNVGTGAYRYSTDGGNTWHPGKPPQ